MFEDVSSELLNLTEYRRSGTPGDWTGASFWYFLREKVLLALGVRPQKEKEELQADIGRGLPQDCGVHGLSLGSQRGTFLLYSL